MKFHQVEKAERSLFLPGIIAIEKAVTYPLGNDFFWIDRGADYFAFFERLGEVYYYAAIANDSSHDLRQVSVSAVGAGVLRQVAFRQGEPVRPAWYLCDLKVHPAYQGQFLSLRIWHYALMVNIQRCASGYAISMNPGDGSVNRFVSLLKRFAPVKFQLSKTLEIYSLTAEEMRSLTPLLIENRGAISYLSLQGIKDLRLLSTGQLLPLLHVQWSAKVSSAIAEPVEGYTHMFCVPAADELSVAIAQRNIYPSATASIISHGMDDSDWRFLQTSDI